MPITVDQMNTRVDVAPRVAESRDTAPPSTGTTSAAPTAGASAEDLRPIVMQIVGSELMNLMRIAGLR